MAAPTDEPIEKSRHLARAEEAEPSGNARYQALVETVSDWIWEVDARGVYTYASPQVRNILGYEPEEVLGKTPFDLMPPEEARRIGSIFADCAADALPIQSLENINRHKNGSLVHLETSGVPVIDGAGILTGYRGIDRDVTRRRELECALERAEQEKLLILDNLSESVVYTDLDLKILWLNKAAYSSHGRTREEFIGRRCYSLWGDGQGPCADCALIRAFQTGTTCEMEKKWPDGRIWLNQGHPVRGENGSVVAGIEVCLDITPLKRAEQALLESERRYRALFESAGDAILLIKGNRYIDCNRKALDMFGGTAEQVVGQECNALSPLRQRGGEFSEKAGNEKIALAMEGKIQRYDWQYRRLDGAILDVEVTLNRVDLGGEYHLLAIVKDLTERKRLQEQLWQSQKMEAVGRLAGGVAHDFNNLLTVINGYSEILLLSPAGIDQSLLQYGREIKAAAERATALTRQLLAFSRRQVLAPKVLDLNQLISNLERMLKRLIGEDIKLVTELRPGLGRVKADPGQIEQVIVNLVVNSRDAMPQGGKLTIITQEAVLGQTLSRFSFPINPGPYVLISVIDTGVGMDAETLEHLFEPFYTTKELGKGTGLGLATVYGIIKQSGGYIWADSSPGAGTRLDVFLPRTDEIPREEESRVSTSELAGGIETILVAEDEAGVRALIERGLSGLGYTVLLAGTGEEALEVSNRHAGQIHLLLTDVVMPGMSGVEVANRLVSGRPEMRILYMSGYTNDAMLRRGVQTAGTPFIQKPFSMQALGHKLRSLLDAPPPRRQPSEI
jgi:PAS domain S-box-containing protein